METIDRLVALAQVWCAAKFFHPYLAYRADIDWDAALIAALPKVRAAASKDDYAAAMQGMLAALGDPVTHVRPHPENIDSAAAVDTPFVRQTPDGDLVIVLNAIQPSDFNGLIGALSDLPDKLAAARGAVFDMRGSRSARGCFGFTSLERRLSTTALAAPGERSRLHVGFKPQRGASSGGYHSAFGVSDGTVFAPHKDARDIPVVFIIDADTAVPFIALALQKAGKAAVMMEGEGHDGAMVSTVAIGIGESLDACLRVSELIHPDGSGGFEPDLTMVKSDRRETLIEAALAWLAQPRRAAREPKRLPAIAEPAAERAYADMNDPSSDYRMLAAFRIWGVFNYFFPYKHLIGEDWLGVLREFIPRFEAAQGPIGYAMTVAQMVARTHDSHCGVNSKVLRDHLGDIPPAVQARMIEGVPVVTRLVDAALAASGIAVGDVILAVDGVDVGERMKLLSGHRATSTPQWQAYITAQYLLAGPDGSTASVRVRSADGEKDVALPRLSANLDRMGEERDRPVLEVLPGNIGYADLDRLPRAAVDEMFDRFRDTKAIIFDMRGYPQGTAWAIAPRLTPRHDVVGALFERPMVTFEAISTRGEPGAQGLQRFWQTLPRTDKWRYDKPTVMLIDGGAISQAEHTGLFFRAANGTRWVGSATAGANGDVTSFVLPGDIGVNFTGQAVMHPDGRQLQRVGLLPDVEVKPTIAGLRAGRDEVLERAIALIGESEG